jgi:hypothetical protein
MTPEEFLKPRFIVILPWPNGSYERGQVCDVFESDGKLKLCGDSKIEPEKWLSHFRKAKWYEHRTIEQLTSIKYMRILEGKSNYYVPGDIVEVKGMTYNNPVLVNGEHNILFDLKGHHFPASQLEPATKQQYETWENYLKQKQ